MFVQRVNATRGCFTIPIAQVNANGMNESSLRDGRYDGVFHLVTAASGAEDFYTLESNEARTETVDMAREVSGLEPDHLAIEVRVRGSRRRPKRSCGDDSPQPCLLPSALALDFSRVRYS